VGERNVILEVDRAATGPHTRSTEQVQPRVGRGGASACGSSGSPLTANTITYASVGDMLGVLDFYPSGSDGWGRLPAMGWAEVVESAHPRWRVGARLTTAGSRWPASSISA
jgi:hypothetical protein